jgi:hypothetical protein
LVVLAIPLRLCAFFSKSTSPVSATITTADEADTVNPLTEKQQEEIIIANTSKTEKLFFTVPPPKYNQ